MHLKTRCRKCNMRAQIILKTVAGVAAMNCVKSQNVKNVV